MRSVVFLVALSLAGAAQAQNMPLTTFVERGTKLEKKGPMALFHRGEIRALQTEMQAANKAVIAEYEANKKSGAKQTFCPVKGQGYRLKPQQLLAQLRAIPAGQARTMTTTDGMRHILKKRFPCQAA